MTLMDVLSETRTAGGRRRLRAWLRAPLLDELSVRARLDAVETLTRAADLRGAVRALLYRAHDLERLAARVATPPAPTRVRWPLWPVPSICCPRQPACWRVTRGCWAACVPA